MSSDFEIAPEYERHAGFVRRLARGLVRDEARADDLAQATWLAALEEPPRSTGDGLRGWLATVARNLARKSGRGDARRSDRERRVARDERTTSVVDSVERQEMLRRLTDGVLSLDEPYRTTVMLSFYEGLSSREIAEQEGVPEPTVRSRKQRALAKLRERLDREHGGDRSAWCVALVSLVAGKRLVELESTAAATASGATLAEVFWMSTKLKVAAVVVVGGLCGLALWKATTGGSVAGGPEAVVVPEAATLVVGDLESAPPIESAPSRERVAAAAPSNTPAEPEPATAPGFGSLLGRVLRSDGTPVAGEPVEVLDWNADPGARMRFVHTDTTGWFRVERLRPGGVNVSPARGAGRSVTIVAGEVTEAELRMKPGFKIAGRVVDADGLPVAGARIWLSDYFNYHEGNYLTETGPSGTFELDELPESRYLGASAPGHAPSPLTYLPDLRGNAALSLATELVLELGGVGGSLEVVALDGDGEPVRDAWVRILGQWPKPRETSAGDQLWYAPNHRGPVDEHGRFLVRGLREGTAKVEVHASGMAPWQDELEIRAGERTNVVCELVPHTVVEGRIALPSGEPAVDVSVRLVTSYEPWIPMTDTDATGHYRLEGLPSGRFTVIAKDKELGKARTHLNLEPGALHTWNATLEPGRVLTGRLEDDEGVALAGWYIAAREGPQGLGGWVQTATTDDAGAFRFVSCPDREFTLHAMKDMGGGPPLAREVVTPDREHVKFVVRRADFPTSWISGVVIGVDGQPVGTTINAWLEGENSAAIHEGDPQTGAFLIEGLKPGRYNLGLRGAGIPYHIARSVTVEPEDGVDLGRIVLAEPGSLAIEVPGAEGDYGPFDLVSVQRLGEDGNDVVGGGQYWNRGDAVQPMTLMPGRYVAKGRVGMNVMSWTAVEIRPGERSRITLDPGAGALSGIYFRIPEGLDLEEFVLELEGPGGRVPLDGNFWGGEVYPVVTRLAPGRYVARVAGDLVGELEFDVLEGVEEEQRFAVDLGG